MDFNYKVSKESAMNMSLDEYIAASGIYLSPLLKSYKSQHDSRNIDNDIDMDTEKTIKEEESSVCGDNCINTLNLTDLRDRLLVKDLPIPIDMSVKPKMNSQQWRLVDPNKGQNRPAGMPPLVNHAGFESILTINQKNVIKTLNSRRRNWRRKNNNPNQLNRHNQNQQQNKNQQQNQKQQQNQNHQQKQNKRQNQVCYQSQNVPNKQNVNKVSNGRVERKTTNNRIWTTAPNQTNQKNNRRRYNGTDFQTCVNISQGPTFDSIPNSNPVDINKIGLPPQNDSRPIISTIESLNQSNVVDAFGAIKLELMPFIAGKLLDAFKGTLNTAGPKYDMKLQKKIHCLQNKSMAYKCPGGEVISSDGPGLNNCKMTPASTGVSLNQRFA